MLCRSNPPSNNNYTKDSLSFIEDKGESSLARKILLDALNGERSRVPPLWMMRQAGRYLPEYRALREKAGSFLNLCFTPELAAEVTLQPIRRFSFDAAILFSDILVIPHALGQTVTFEAGEGPRLDPIGSRADLGRLAMKADHAVLAPVYETVRRVKTLLPDHVALIGFCGAPWTVATYMIAGRGTPDQLPARRFAYEDPDGFALLIDRLVESSTEYLLAQIHAGAEVVQIFDTWAGILPDAEFTRWCVKPVEKMVSQLRTRAPGVKIIAFPRGAGSRLVSFVDAVKPDGLSLDWAVDTDFAREQLQSRLTIQGNLDPIALLTGGAALDRSVDHICRSFGDGPFIFNLGHGILPETPIAHVERMIARVRAA